MCVCVCVCVCVRACVLVCRCNFCGFGKVEALTLREQPVTFDCGTQRRMETQTAWPRIYPKVIRIAVSAMFVYKKDKGMKTTAKEATRKGRRPGLFLTLASLKTLAV